VKLLAQVAAIALGGGLLTLGLRLAGRSLAPALGVGVVALCLVGAATVVRLPRTADELRDDRRYAAPLPRRAVEAAGANRQPGLEIDAGFFEWAAQRLPGRASFFVVTQPRHRPSYQWGTLRLLPRLATTDAGRASWLVFYDRDPRAPGAPRFDPRTLVVYRPGFALARRQDAS
jgi:hypothetical protein